MSAAEVVAQTDYSQYGEQEHILRECPHHGRFLDIGAFDGLTFSNTRALALDRQWIGVYIEPSPFVIPGLLRNSVGHDRLVIIQAAVGFEPHPVLMWVTDDLLSTTEQKNYDAWKDTAKFHGQIYVPQLTLEMIFNQFGEFDFVNIDTEGTSCSLFIRMLQLGHFPRCVCVEHDNRIVELMLAAQSANYESVHMNGTNIVLRRKGL